MKSINLKENQFIQFHQKISFKFDGVKYFGYKGDTIASALLRNNINLVRDEDLFAWKFAKRGFFKFKENIPKINQRILENFSKNNF